MWGPLPVWLLPYVWSEWLDQWEMLKIVVSLKDTESQSLLNPYLVMGKVTVIPYPVLV